MLIIYLVDRKSQGPGTGCESHVQGRWSDVIDCDLNAGFFLVKVGRQTQGLAS